MSLWFDLRPANTNRTGKFQHRRRIGTETADGKSYRGWSYQLIQHRSGATVPRQVFNVSIADPRGHRARYLQGFSTMGQATAAARDWIDERTDTETMTDVDH